MRTDSILRALAVPFLVASSAGCQIIPDWSQIAFDATKPAEVDSKLLVHVDDSATNLLRAEVDGVSGWFALDSGAAVSVLDSGYADELRLKRGLALPLNRTVAAYTVHATTANVGQLVATKPGFVALDLDAFLRRLGLEDGVQMADGRIVGILGAPLFRRSVVTVDYGEPNRISISPPGAVVSPRRWVSARIPDTTIAVEGVIAGERGWFEVDTGKSYTISLSSHFAARTGLDKLPPERIFDNHRLEGVSKEHVITVDELEIAGERLTKVAVHLRLPGTSAAAQEGQIDGLVGRGILQRFGIVTFDYPGSRLGLGDGEAESESTSEH